MEDARQVAVGKGQLGTVRMYQRRYTEALAAYEEAHKIFEKLGEPASVATVWHRIGVVHQKVRQPAAAERAYRESLTIKVRLGDIAGQADTLNQLGNLYQYVLGRLEEAAAFYHQAADKYVQIEDTANKGIVRSNFADTLRKLGRHGEARQEIRRAIDCKKPFGHAVEPWKTWSILSDIERADGQPAAATAARQRAIELFLAYRHDGGENHEGGGQLCAAVTEAMLAGNLQEVAHMLAELRSRPNLPAYVPPLLDALEAILGGRRDPSLAQHPDLDYTYAAEILLLLEALPRADH